MQFPCTELRCLSARHLQCIENTGSLLRAKDSKLTTFKQALMQMQKNNIQHINENTFRNIFPSRFKQLGLKKYNQTPCAKKTTRRIKGKLSLSPPSWHSLKQITNNSCFKFEPQSRIFSLDRGIPSTT